MARIMTQLSGQSVWPVETVTVRLWDELTNTVSTVVTGVSMLVVQQVPSGADLALMLGVRPHAIRNQPVDYFCVYDAPLDASPPAGARWLRPRDRIVRASGLTVEINQVFPTEDDPITLAQIAYGTVMPNPGEVVPRR